jgi:hypothetical protein
MDNVLFISVIVDAFSFRVVIYSFFSSLSRALPLCRDNFLIVLKAFWGGTRQRLFWCAKIEVFVILKAAWWEKLRTKDLVLFSHNDWLLFPLSVHEIYGPNRIKQCPNTQNDQWYHMLNIYERYDGWKQIEVSTYLILFHITRSTHITTSSKSERKSEDVAGESCISVKQNWSSRQ